MTNGHLYFIKDIFYEEFANENLKPNKTIDKDGNIHNRPCYYSFQDGDIMWMIPVSSQIEKYEKIFRQKTKNGKPCDTIVFGYVKGNKNAFLIQNMIPVKAEYINNIYMDKDTQKPIELNVKLKKRIKCKSS